LAIAFTKYDVKMLKPVSYK